MTAKQLDPPPDVPRLAEHAYFVYGTVVNFKNYQGLPMPEWNDLTTIIQEAWCEVVEEVLRRA
jgi:hypothetical protein